MNKILLFAAFTLCTPALAQQAPVKQDPVAAINPSALTVNDCLTILSGLNALDGYQSVINAGKPNEQVVVRAYEFNNAALRADIADNITALTALQKSSQEIQQKIFMEVAAGDVDIKPGTEKMAAYSKQLTELTQRPCVVQLKRIKTGDLKLDKNEISSSTLSALDKIRDK